jgi:hypothetical protein
MTVLTNYVPASTAQMNFINDLLDGREMPASVLAGFKTMVSSPSFDKRQASMVIDTLKVMPRKAAPSASASASAPKAALVEALASIPNSKYAIPTDKVDIVIKDINLTGDLLFIEVREYMGTRYMRRLTGSLGGFTRSKLSPDDTLALAKIIESDPYSYTKLFGQHYSCCGKCGAELTDPVSRSLLLGPTCRQAFGV